MEIRLPDTVGGLGRQSHTLAMLVLSVCVHALL